MKRGIFVSLMFSALLSAPALAQRPPEPLVTIRDALVATTSGKPVERAQVRQAIAAAAARDPSWSLADEGADRVLATRRWRDHAIVIEVRYSPERYSLLYRDSTNMKYNAGGSGDSRDRNAKFGVPPSTGPEIHPFYNRYVRELRDGIAAELRKL
jgi:hypothetical protein